MNTPSPLAPITAAAFDAYNQGGPPDRAGLTWDGKPVPPFESVGASVTHKWRSAASVAALAGAHLMLELLAAGRSAEEVRELVERELACPPFAPT